MFSKKFINSQSHNLLDISIPVMYYICCENVRYSDIKFLPIQHRWQIILFLYRLRPTGRHVKCSLLKQFTTKFLQKRNLYSPRYFSLWKFVMPFLKVNIKHRKVERLLFLKMIFSSIFIQFVMISKADALPDIIKIGKLLKKSFKGILKANLNYFQEDYLTLPTR